MTRCVRAVLTIPIFVISVAPARAQTATYHLHKQVSFSSSVLDQLKPNPPDDAAVAIASADMKNTTANEFLIKRFDTQLNVPNAGGYLPASATVNFRLYMSKSTLQWGVFVPKVKLFLNNESGTLLCSSTGGSTLSTTVTQFLLSCTTPSTPVFMTNTDRFLLWVGVGINTAPGNHTVTASVSIEGTPTGNYDSRFDMPLPPPPTISGLTPIRGPQNTFVHITGSNFGATRGTSTITFTNNVTATQYPSWSSSAIDVLVPASAATGAVKVTVGGTSSTTNPTLTVTPSPTITSLNPAAAAAGQAVTINGQYFLAAQADGSSTVTFNGKPATITSWSDSSISTSVPTGAASGPVVVTVSGNASGGATFSVVTTGTVAGTITRASNGTALSGATVQAVLIGGIKGTATTAANGTYSIGNLDPGTYDVRVLATGFSSEVRSGTNVSANVTTSVNVGLAQPGSISGTVTQSDGTTPIVGAAVAMYSGPLQKGTASTNGSGFYSISGLHAGAYTVQAANVGNRTREQGAVVNENSTTTANISLDAAPSGPVLYAYDAIGRLIQVTDPSGDAAIYHYDPVGNITSIERPGVSVVSISGFTPTSGSVGSSITISGTAFSTTSANTVTFGAGQVSVTAATPNQLTVIVPAGASTSQLAVTNAGGAATSADTFTVTAAATGAPTITGFSPSIGTVGTSVTITGSNFGTTAANDRVTANLTFMSVSTATATSLTAPIPSSGSGPITVATPAGSAVTTADLFIAPPPYTANQVEFTQRMAIGATQIVTINTATHIGLVTFTGTSGQRVSLLGTQGMSGFYFGCDVNVRVFTPYGSPLGPMTCVEQSGFLDVQTLGATGIYTILVVPTDPATGSVTLTLVDVPADTTQTIPTNGSPVTVTTTTAGQNAKLSFSATAGQRISLVGSNGMTAQVLGCDVNVTIIAPDTTPVVGGSGCMEQSGFIDPVSLPNAGLPTTGTYTILVDPAESAKGNVTLSLNTVTDFSGTITADGSLMTVPITTPGQNGIVTFSGTASQWVSLSANGISGQLGFACDVNVSILKPDNGGTLVAPTCVEGAGFIDAIQLPTTGTYTIFVDPASTVTGNLTLNLYTVTDFGGTIAADGSSVTIPFDTPGKNGTLTFLGTALQWVSVTTSGITGQIAFACDVNLSILNPDTSTLLSPSCVEGNAFIDAIQLPSTGTYTIFIDPASNAQGNLTLTLYTVTNATGSVVVNGGALSRSTTVPGQNIDVTFVGASGQTVRGVTTSGTSVCVALKILRQDGTTQVSSYSACGTTITMPATTLPAGETYHLIVDPSGTTTGTFSVSVVSP